ncbi:MAG: hypothetical protein K8R53_01160, partial [Bacteroidales bacterium]|nr:hypothetical protein [Bacteroidales bacterium]
CKKRQGKKSIDESLESGIDIYYCKYCEQDKKIGSELPKKKLIAFYNENNKGYSALSYSFKLCDDRVEGNPYLVYKLYSTMHEQNFSENYYQKFIANYIPINDGNTKCDEDCSDYFDCQQKPDKNNPIFFSCIANASEGRKVIGVLKADVDNLGQIFNTCLKSETLEKKVSISKFATLSRMLELFFAGRIQSLLEEKYQYVYTVYSGGDDLLLIGPWDNIIEFTNELYNEFKGYVCNNNDVHFSAGIILSKPHAPVVSSTLFAEEALEYSKNRKRRDEDWKFVKNTKAKVKPKNHLTVFNETVSLSSLSQLIQSASEVTEWYGQRLLSGSFIRNLLHYFSLFKSYYLPYDENVKFGKVLGLMFLPLLSYDISRNLPRADSKNDVDRKIRLWADSLRSNENLDFSQNIDLQFLSLIANYALNKNRS